MRVALFDSVSSRIATGITVCGLVSMILATGPARGQQQPTAGVAIDLLTRVSLPDGVVAGEWSKQGAELRVNTAVPARCVLPYDVRSGYDLDVAFTRINGEDSVGIIIPVGAGQCIVNLGAFKGEAHGIAMINGKKARANETTVRPGKLSNNRRYRVQIGVRLDGGKTTIAVDLDGGKLMRWSGKQSALTLVGLWRIPSKTRVALTAHKNTTVFHRARLRLMAGGAVAPVAKVRPAPARPSRPDAASGLKTVEFEGRKWVAGLAKRATVEKYRGKTALHVVGGESAYVYLPDVEFQDGVIEVDIASPTFSGVGFRGRQGGTRVEKPYFRPQNSNTEKHEKTVQYAVLGRPDGGWRYLRTNFPGKYEAGADMKKGEWFHARFEIQGATLKIFVNDGPKPVLVVEKMLDGVSKGTMGVWAYNAYFANFEYRAAK